MAALFFCVSPEGDLVSPAIAKMRDDKLVLMTEAGERVITIEVAETLADKSKGLMFRPSLAEGHGMLFLYEGPQEISMWMSNTYMPLDMVFIRADGTVHRIETNAEPLSEKIIASKGPVTSILELAGGAAQRLGLKPGDKVRYPHFRAAVPVTP